MYVPTESKQQLEALTEEFNKQTGKKLTEKVVLSICLSLVHDGVFQKGWNVRKKINGKEGEIRDI